MFDLEGIERTIAAYEKNPNKWGDYNFAFNLNLKPISLEDLQKIFNVEPNDPDKGIAHLIDFYVIDKIRGEALKNFIIGELDFEKYFYQLESHIN